MDSYELEKYKLTVVSCCGCGKPITIAVPFKGNPICSECKYKQEVLGKILCGKK